MKAILIFAAMLLGCTGAQKSVQTSEVNQADSSGSADNSQNSLDWAGSYSGTLPCDNCEGIATTISLNDDLTFKEKRRSLGTSDSMREIAGKFAWNPSGNTITLTASDGTNRQYVVGENKLTQLDANGHKFEGDEAHRYILSKQNFELLEKYWRLVKLNGKPIERDSTIQREAHIIFKEADNRIIGNGECNSISASFMTEGTNSIKVGRMISTKMACPRMAVESELLRGFENIDSFNVVGDTLTLNSGSTPIATFNAAYMK